MNDESAPMFHGKAIVERRLQAPLAENQSLGERKIIALPVKQIDTLLFDACPSTSQAQLTRWRRQYVAAHNDATLQQLLVDARREQTLATTSGARKRKQRDVRNADELARCLAGDEKRRRRDAFFQELALVVPLAGPSAALVSDVRNVECNVCFERFNVDATLHCVKSERDTICRHCFVHYAREKAGTETLESLPCVVCKAGYDRLVAQVNLPPDVFEQLQHNGTALDQRVALASDVKAVLYCQCGTVAVVESKDVGNGIVVCVCGIGYCVGCGNFAHAGTLCPPARETIRWLDKHGKQCPNCGEGIEKNGGCQHMKCRSCRFEFCWQCLKRWKGSCRH